MNAETAKPLTPYEALGGHDSIAAIVNRFYDLMESEPEYAALRAMHATDLAPMRRSLAGWLNAWAGGPRDWFEENPGKCMMSAHRSLGVVPETANQWANAMARAIADTDVPNHEIGEMMAARLRTMSQAMVERAI